MMFMTFGIYGRSILREPIWQYMIPALVSTAIIGLVWLGWKQRRRTDLIAFTCRVSVSYTHLDHYCWYYLYFR